MTERRHKVIRLSTLALEELLNGEIECLDYPTGARIVGMRVDLSWNSVELLLEHQSFPELDDASMAPFVELTFIRPVHACEI